MTELHVDCRAEREAIERQITKLLARCLCRLLDDDPDGLTEPRPGIEADTEDWAEMPAAHRWRLWVSHAQDLITTINTSGIAWLAPYELTDGMYAASDGYLDDWESMRTAYLGKP